MKLLNSSILIQMIQMGARNLSNNKDMINKLNVFPVPDGDTGTNMNLSMQSAVQSIQQLEESPSMELVLKAFSKGLLMGARGNSGVILSQLFRGFCAALEQTETIDTKQFAEGLQAGVDVAYKAVANPVEGTILTVAKDTAKFALTHAETEDDFVPFMETVIKEANRSLDHTPELLPVLKEVGVVDSGGKGLVTVYEGFLAMLKGEALPEPEMDVEALIKHEHEKSVQSFISKDSIEKGYCTEFFVEITSDAFDENEFRDTLAQYGDSLLVATTDDIVKVHIHSETPGEVMSIAQKYGELDRIDIENMRKQYEHIVEQENAEVKDPIDVGIITVAFGKGITQTFNSIGATTIIEGGQTMNPSTEDVLAAIEKTNAAHTFILPNNKNIVLAANQAKEISDKSITIIPTKSVPEGISALLAYDESFSNEENEQAMLEAMQDIKTGSVTYATRDTVINNMEIKQGAYIGLNDDTIKVTKDNQLDTIQALLAEIVDEDEDELITLFYGENVTEDEIENIESFVEETFEDVEIEVHEGNQPIYAYIFMVE
ncbi:MAG TPA: DAK2 domain-containing protein [Candidatus Pseudogracilibacillus intestinigallinarum]|uniref:DAK2 domain-containing protein n=1 Tax=Candidatus Pseudogracilibacillus intestinigallinarum TaxID=2838742 RepID=A0A9D1PKP2_9BACI|nr:DAK2 domain-containing protein [Candidatus Pseudogracilibacillus intestinigallinarum]